MRSLVLASTSPYRRQLLDRLGVTYTAAPHRCDERAVGAGSTDAAELVRILARAKVESLASDHRGAHVLGSDQVVAIDGEVLGKPGDAAGAMAQLRRLRGRTHRLLTAVALRRPDGSVREALDEHRMTMRALEDAEIDRYVRAERPFDCAGSYKIEGLGIALFESIEGRDFTAIVGMPLLTVARLLREAGWAIP